VYGKRFRTLPSWIRHLGDDHIDVLKLDVDGAEFDVMQMLLSPKTGL
jgi:hypothetical protein